MLPTCTFASTPVSNADSFDQELLRSVRFSKPKPGEFLAPDPLSAPISGAMMTLPGLRYPLGPFETLRIKAFSRIRHLKPALPCAR
jgi:hypothetical protein